MIEPRRLISLRADTLRDLQRSEVTATVLSGAGTRSETGGAPLAPVEGETYPCMMQTQEQEAENAAGGAGRVQSAARFYCVLPWDAAIPRRASLRIDSPVEDSTVWQVVDSNVAETNRFDLKLELVRAS